ncbi:hypothetical protein EDB92DRAFT_2109063 [Lactarius akahatsu]|uniref:Uncharacterized protein n=1 Tax=Lactarius akahatsu TaxID=416441 RepID=A0AAD4L7X7_9AGAM|nr:hypothetical protein EDB92DRAFT_2109063 [Lactarius akahatsu]
MNTRSRATNKTCGLGQALGVEAISHRKHRTGSQENENQFTDRERERAYYTKDVCVIKLDEKKFLPNFKSNVIDIVTFTVVWHVKGPWEVTQKGNARDAHSEFDYPEDRLFGLGAILSAAKIRKPNDQDHNGDPVRYVIRQGLTGLTTRTTVGRLTGFESHERHYSSTRSTGVGDSGGLIASSLVEFVALLTDPMPMYCL